MQDCIGQLASIVPRNCAGPVYVHSDLVGASVFVPRERDRNKLFDSHLRLLADLYSGRPLWVPAYNYDFPESGVFDTDRSVSESGVFSELFRQYKKQWRTLDPIFSTCGTGPDPGRPPENEAMTAFDGDSVFAKLIQLDGSLLFYGMGFSTPTILHHLEHLVGPVYRYDKTFTGVIVDGEDRHDVTYTYHVRPMGHRLDYDFEKLLNDLSANQLARVIDKQFAITVEARALKQFWLDKLKQDPFYFLDQRSREWVIPRIEQLGRRFERADFEASLVGG